MQKDFITLLLAFVYCFFSYSVSLKSITLNKYAHGLQNVFDFGLNGGLLSRSCFGYDILSSRSFLCTFVCVVPIMCTFSLAAEFVNMLRTKTKPSVYVFSLAFRFILLPCMLLLVLMRDQILSIILEPNQYVLVTKMYITFSFRTSGDFR